MDYKDKYIKYKTKYLNLLSDNIPIMTGGKINKNILFIFFNGGGATKDMWYEFQGCKTNIISKIKKLGKIYLYDPVTTLTEKSIDKFVGSSDKYIFTMDDLDLENHCRELFDNVNKLADNFILISHSRGYMYANVFSKLYLKHILGYINIDGGKPICEYEEYLKLNKSKYDDITNYDLLQLQNELKTSNANERKQIEKKLSNIVCYFIYKQYIKTIVKFNFPVYILNNIYDDANINICMDDYVKTTLRYKFDYNKELSSNQNVKSIWQ